jgi:hypothetical protein
MHRLFIPQDRLPTPKSSMGEIQYGKENRIQSFTIGWLPSQGSLRYRREGGANRYPSLSSVAEEGTHRRHSHSDATCRATFSAREGTTCSRLGLGNRPVLAADCGINRGKSREVCEECGGQSRHLLRCINRHCATNASAIVSFASQRCVWERWCSATSAAHRGAAAFGGFGLA